MGLFARISEKFFGKGLQRIVESIYGEDFNISAQENNFPESMYITPATCTIK